MFQDLLPSLLSHLWTITPPQVCLSAPSLASCFVVCLTFCVCAHLFCVLLLLLWCSVWTVSSFCVHVELALPYLVFFGSFPAFYLSVVYWIKTVCTCNWLPGFMTECLALIWMQQNWGAKAGVGSTGPSTQAALAAAWKTGQELQWYHCTAVPEKMSGEGAQTQIRAVIVVSPPTSHPYSEWCSDFLPSL